MADGRANGSSSALFPKSHGRQRVDDRRVLSGIIFVNRNGLRWRDAPKEYGPAKTLYNRWKRWGDKGVFIQMMEGLAVPEAAEHKTIMIDATYLKAHRTASSLRVKGGAGRLIGRTKGGMNTKLHAVTDASGRPISFFITAGRSAITPVLPPCLMNFPRPNGCWPTVAMMPTGIVTLYRRRDHSCIPCRKSRKKTIKYDKRRYKRRNRIEIMFGRLKDWRRVATRYDRCPMAFLRHRSRCDRYLLAMSNES